MQRSSAITPTGQKHRIIPPVYGLPPNAGGTPPPSGMPLLRWDLRQDLRPSREAVKTNVKRTAPTQVKTIRLPPKEVPALPDPLIWTRNMSRVIFDVLAGRRNVATIRRWIEPSLYNRLHARVQSLPPPATQTMSAKVRVAKIHPVSDTVIETSAVIEEQNRCRAVAMRLEEFRGRWKITALEIG